MKQEHFINTSRLKNIAGVAELLSELLRELTDYEKEVLSRYGVHQTKRNKLKVTLKKLCQFSDSAHNQSNEL